MPSTAQSSAFIDALSESLLPSTEDHQRRPSYDVTNSDAAEDSAAPKLSNNNDYNNFNNDDEQMLSRLHAEIKADEDLAVKAAVLLKLLEVCLIEKYKSPTLSLLFTSMKSDLVFILSQSGQIKSHGCGIFGHQRIPVDIVWLNNCPLCIG